MSQGSEQRGDRPPRSLSWSLRLSRGLGWKGGGDFRHSLGNKVHTGSRLLEASPGRLSAAEVRRQAFQIRRAWPEWGPRLSVTLSNVTWMFHTVLGPIPVKTKENFWNKTSGMVAASMGGGVRQAGVSMQPHSSQLSHMQSEN